MDKITELFFDPKRWQYAIAKGIDKDISKAQLYQLTKPDVRIAMAKAINDGKYQIAPPHTALIPKNEPGEFRTVYINEPVDRILLSIANDLLFELTPEMVHPMCKSYQKGVSCGSVVKEIARTINSTPSEKVGFKSDLSKYFDSVPLRYIDEAFDKVEAKYGKSKLIDVLRAYYHSNWYFDPDGNLVEKYQSLKQGCSVASWLADVILYHIDDKLSRFDGMYRRYSDDMIFIGKDYPKAMAILTDELARMGMKLNPKKVEYLDHGHWFKFLGFSIRNTDISFGNSQVKKFQKEIEKRTTKKRGTTYRKAVNSVNRFLYKGDGIHAWATIWLNTVNNQHDIDELNKFVMDSLRAVKTGRKKIGGLGYVKAGKDGCVARGKGRNVKANREKTAAIDGYLSLTCMRNALITRKAVYRTLVNQL